MNADTKVSVGIALKATVEALRALEATTPPAEPTRDDHALDYAIDLLNEARILYAIELLNEARILLRSLLTGGPQPR